MDDAGVVVGRLARLLSKEGGAGPPDWPALLEAAAQAADLPAAYLTRRTTSGTPLEVLARSPGAAAWPPAYPAAEGYSSLVAAAPLLHLPDTQADPRLSAHPARRLFPQVGAYIGVPLRAAGGRLLGLLELAGPDPQPRPPDPILLVIAGVLAAHLAAAELRARDTWLVSLIGHEFRTPLTTIRGYGELILESPAIPAETVDFATEILTALHGLNTTISELLMLLRAEDDAGWSPAPLDLNALLVTLAAQDGLLTEPAVLHPAPALPRVLGDPQGLEDGLHYLLVGLQQIAPGALAVYSRADEGAVLIEIALTAPVGSEVPPYVFTPELWTRPARFRSWPGVSLAFMIAGRLLTRYDGTLWVAAAEPGLRVYVRLPSA